MTTESNNNETRGHAKTLDGVVVSNAMQKSVVVSIQRQVKHAQYGKYVKRTKRCIAHDEKNSCSVGDIVRIVETRPMSKTKRWRVKEVLIKAE